MMIMRIWMKHEYVTLICTNYLIKFTCQPVTPTLTYSIYIFFGKMIFIVCEQKNRQKNTNKCYIQHT